MSVEGRELLLPPPFTPFPVGSIKYFKICKGYELETSWLLVDTHHHTCAHTKLIKRKKVWFQRIWLLRHYYSLNTMTSFSFWTGFGQRRRFTFSKILLSLPTLLKGLGYRKWKQTSKRKRYLSVLRCVSPSLKIEILPYFAAPKNEKSLVLRLGQPPKKCHMFSPLFPPPHP